MPESKKKLFKRETCSKALLAFIEKVEHVNLGTSDYPYPDKIVDVIVFGSYMDKSKNRIHDLDICFVAEEHRELWKDWTAHYGSNFPNNDFFYQLFLPELARNRYLQQGQRVISLHPECDLEIALSGPHMYVVKDGNILRENIETLI